MDRTRDIRCGTVIGRLNRPGYTTGTVLSKEYLYGVFGDRATHRWEPAPIIPVSGHAPDQFTMDAALAMVDEFDPQPDVREPRRHRPVRARRLHRQRRPAAAAAGAGRHRPAGRSGSSTCSKTTGRWRALDRDRARRPLDGLVAPRRRDQPAPARWTPTRCSPARSRSPTTAAPTSSTGPAPPTSAARAIARMQRIARATAGVLAAHDRRRRGCGSAPRPATSSSSARPAGGSASRTRPATRSPATTATRPPGRSRSSSAAATPTCPRRRASSAHGPHRRRRPDRRRVLRGRRPRGGYDGRNRL